MRESLREGGVVGACVWDYAEGMEFLRAFWDAAVALDPKAEALDEGRRFPLCRPDALSALFGQAGLRDVAVKGLVVPGHFRSFDSSRRRDPAERASMGGARLEVRLIGLLFYLGRSFTDHREKRWS